MSDPDGPGAASDHNGPGAASAPAPRTVSVARFLPRTTAEGPGLRSALWVQGCSIRCRGCFNPHLLGFRGGTPYAPEDLITQILAAGTDGVTLLGGEPFDQASALAAVAAGVGDAGLSVMTFTGYTLQYLRAAADSGRTGIRQLLDATDLLAAGPFLQDQVDPVRPWIGSANQELIITSNRFPHLRDQLTSARDRIEIWVDTGGQVAVNGWADPDLLDALLRDISDLRGPSGDRKR